MSQAVVSQDANIELVDVFVEVSGLNHSDQSDGFKARPSEADFGDLVSRVGREGSTDVLASFGREVRITTQVKFRQIAEGLRECLRQV